MGRHAPALGTRKTDSLQSGKVRIPRHAWGPQGSGHYAERIVPIRLGCAPCKKAIPQLNELRTKFKGRPVEFIALAGDSAENLRAYLEEHPFD